MQEQVVEHFNKGKDSVLALEKVKNKAWTDILRGNYTVMANKQLKCWEDAEDAVQEAYTKVLEQLAKGKEIKNLNGYFTIVLRHCIVDVYNRNRNRPDADSSDGSEDYNTDEENKEQLEDYFLRLEELENVEKVLKKFPQHYQDIYKLKYIYEHSAKDIADVLGRGLRTVTTALYRMNKKLKEERNNE